MSSSERPGEEAEDFKMSPTKVWRSLQRRAGPEHFLLTVESFSVLSESKLEKYESDEFEASGYKWRLILYPKGDKERDGGNHISLYLSISDTKSLPQDWEVKAHFTLFVYNNISDMYLTFQVENASARRFHELKTERGFAQLIELDYFKESSNGFLFDDTCVFGAEVFVNTSSAVKMQRLSMTKYIIFSWKVCNFSTIKDEFLYSDKFKIGDQQWKLVLYPKGNGDGKDKSVSLFLRIADESTLPANWKAYVEYKIRIKSKVNDNNVENQATRWFDYSNLSFGCQSFIALSDLNDRTKGFINEDTLDAEVEIKIAAMTKSFK